jgi:hypothetical protein
MADSVEKRLALADEGAYAGRLQDLLAQVLNLSGEPPLLAAAARGAARDPVRWLERAERS